MQKQKLEGRFKFRGNAGVRAELLFNTAALAVMNEAVLQQTAEGRTWRDAAGSTLKAGTNIHFCWSNKNM